MILGEIVAIAQQSVVGVQPAQAKRADPLRGDSCGDISGGLLAPYVKYGGCLQPGGTSRMRLHQSPDDTMPLSGCSTEKLSGVVLSHSLIQHRDDPDLEHRDSVGPWWRTIGKHCPLNCQIIQWPLSIEDSPQLPDLRVKR
jgi:hypothetical protein